MDIYMPMKHSPETYFAILFKKMQLVKENCLAM